MFTVGGRVLISHSTSRLVMALGDEDVRHDVSVLFLDLSVCAVDARMKFVHWVGRVHPVSCPFRFVVLTTTVVFTGIACR